MSGSASMLRLVEVLPQRKQCAKEKGINEELCVVGMVVAWGVCGVQLESKARHETRKTVCHMEISGLYPPYKWELSQVFKKRNVFYNGLGLLSS